MNPSPNQTPLRQFTRFTLIGVRDGMYLVTGGYTWVSIIDGHLQRFTSVPEGCGMQISRETKIIEVVEPQQ